MGQKTEIVKKGEDRIRKWKKKGSQRKDETRGESSDYVLGLHMCECTVMNN